MTELALGIDIGGTKIAFGVINTQGETVAESRMDTQPADGPDVTIGRMATEALRLIDETGGVNGVGIGSPGWIDSAAGTVKNAVNLGWTDVPLVPHLRARLPHTLPVKLAVDVHAALVGEVMFGAARGASNVVQLAVGTGLGGAAMVNGHLVTGATFFAMELGHWFTGINPQRTCNCGRNGCAETTLSGLGVIAGMAAHRAEHAHTPLARMESPTTYDWYQHIATNDPLSLHVLDDMRETLARVIGATVAVVNPSHVVISGGLGNAIYAPLTDGLHERVAAHVMGPLHESLAIVPSQVVSSTVGAAALVWHG